MNRNYEAFVSAVEVGEYRNNVSALGCMLCSAILAFSLRVDINVISVVGSGAVAAVMMGYLIMLIRKNPKKLLLFDCLQGVILFSSVCSLTVNLLHDTNIYIIAVILVLTGFVISTTVSLILVSYRLKNNYYEKNKKRTIEYMTIVGLGILSGVLSQMIAEVTSYSKKLMIVGTVVLMCVMGFKTAEGVARYYVARKYNLYSAVRVKSDEG